MVKFNLYKSYNVQIALKLTKLSKNTKISNSKVSLLKYLIHESSNYVLEKHCHKLPKK